MFHRIVAIVAVHAYELGVYQTDFAAMDICWGCFD